MHSFDYFLFALACLFFCPAHVCAQAGSNTVDPDSFYYKFDQNPRYPGGDPEMYQFLEQQLMLTIPTPELERIYKYDYRSLMKLYLDTAGHIIDVKMDARSDDTWLLDEIIAAFEKMPPWKPGMIDSQKVRSLVYVMVHLTFKDKESAYRTGEWNYMDGLIRVVYQPVFSNSVVYAQPVKKDNTLKGIIVAIALTLIVAGYTVWLNSR